MSKEPDILPEDYDDWESDYYARRSSGCLVGCAFMVGVVVFSFIAYLISKLL